LDGIGVACVWVNCGGGDPGGLGVLGYCFLIGLVGGGLGDDGRLGNFGGAGFSFLPLDFDRVLLETGLCGVTGYVFPDPSPDSPGLLIYISIRVCLII